MAIQKKIKVGYTKRRRVCPIDESIVYICMAPRQVHRAFLELGTRQYSNDEKTQFTQFKIIPMKKILLIEDNKEVRESTAEILELANYKVVTAANGKIGVELAGKENPDLIVCDIMMPELDGYGVVYMLSKKPETSSIPLIFLTAKSDKLDIRKGMSMGADDYLTKPFEEMELLSAIEVRLKKSDAFKKEFSKTIEGLGEF